MDKLIGGIAQYIKKNDLIHPGDHVIVGLSGGADSVFLLYALKAVMPMFAFTLSAFHVHHGIRGEEADRDLQFAEALCKKESIPFSFVHVDAPLYAAEKHLSLEEAGRILRYQAFATERDKISAEMNACKTSNDSNAGNLEHTRKTSTKIEKVTDVCDAFVSQEKQQVLLAVAHHMDDQAETILHNMLRGSGLRGLRGMEPKHDFIIRPLLSIRRSDIVTWLSTNKISYIEDSTNADDRYTRNRIRHILLPEMTEINRDAVEHLSGIAENAAEADQYFRDKAEVFVREYEDIKDRSIGINAIELRKLKRIEREYVYIELLRRLEIPLKDIGRVHLSALDRLLFGPGNGHLDLPYRVTGELLKKRLVLTVHKNIVSMERRRNHGTACESSDS